MVSILIVDDEPLIRKGLEGLDWESIGVYVVGAVSNGLDALTLIRRYKPKILFTDIKMPGIDGLQLIKMAQQLCSEIRCVVLTGYSDFDYAQQAIRLHVDDYILKPCEPHGVLDTIGRIARSMVSAGDLLSERKSKSFEDDFRSAMKGLALPMDTKLNELNTAAFVVGLIQHEEPNRRRRVIDLINQECRDKDLPECWLVPMESDQSAVIFHDRFRRIIGFEDTIAMNCYHALKRVDISDLRMGLSMQVSGIKCLREGYLQAQKCLSLLFSQQDTCFYRYSNYQVHIIPPDTPIHQVKEILSRCEKRDVVGMEKAVDALKMHYWKNPVEDNYIKYVFIDICRSSQHLLYQKTGETIPPLSMEDYLAVSDMQSIDELAEYTKHFLLKNITAMRREYMDGTDRINEQVLAFVRRNYKDNISLGDLAEHIHMNRDYLGRLIKKQFNCTFNQLLLATRLTIAGKLLIDSEMPISRVAESVGINDPRYFGQLFKEKHQMTPSEYRKKAQPQTAPHLIIDFRKLFFKEGLDKR